MTSSTAPRVEVKTAQSCPLCRDPLTSLPQLRVCPACQVIHHQDCVDELGHCGTMGCRGLHDQTASRSASAPRQDNEASRTLSALVYLGNLVGAAFLPSLIVYLYARRNGDDFAKLHAKQAVWLALLTVLTLGLALPLTLACALYAGRKAVQGEWWVLPGLRGERWAPRPLQRLSELDAQRKWELQRKAGQTTVHPLLRPLGWALEPR